MSEKLSLRVIFDWSVLLKSSSCSDKGVGIIDGLIVDVKKETFRSV